MNVESILKAAARFADASVQCRRSPDAAADDYMTGILREKVLPLFVEHAALMVEAVAATVQAGNPDDPDVVTGAVAVILARSVCVTFNAHAARDCRERNARDSLAPIHTGPLGRLERFTIAPLMVEEVRIVLASCPNPPEPFYVSDPVDVAELASEIETQLAQWFGRLAGFSVEVEGDSTGDVGGDIAAILRTAWVHVAATFHDQIVAAAVARRRPPRPWAFEPYRDQFQKLLTEVAGDKFRERLRGRAVDVRIESSPEQPNVPTPSIN